MRRWPAPAGVFVSALATACGPRDLPNDQVIESAHFRYHTRADVELDPAILDRLETMRAEVDIAYGIDSGFVDYYRFRDIDDLVASSPCLKPCTSGRTVFSHVPIHEHEMIHALFSDAGEAALVLQEGIAQHAACFQPNLAGRVDPASWASALRSGSSGSMYDFGERLTAWMLETGGAKKFVDFYSTSLYTTDPALFALQFERAWGRRMADVAVIVDDARYAGSACPCTAPGLATDGSVTRFVAGQEYRVLDVPAESLLELANEGEQIVFPASCANAADDVGGPAPTPVQPTTTIARIGAGKYAITSLFDRVDLGTAAVRATLKPVTDWSCAAAPQVALGSQDVALWVTPDLAGGETWFRLELTSPHFVDPLSYDTRFDFCSSCEPTTCSPPLFVDATDQVALLGPWNGLIRLSSRSDGRRVGASIGVKFRAPR